VSSTASGDNLSEHVRKADGAPTERLSKVRCASYKLPQPEYGSSIVYGNSLSKRVLTTRKAPIERLSKVRRVPCHQVPGCSQAFFSLRKRRFAGQSVLPHDSLLKRQAKRVLESTSAPIERLSKAGRVSCDLTPGFSQA